MHTLSLLQMSLPGQGDKLECVLIKLVPYLAMDALESEAKEA